MSRSKRIIIVVALGLFALSCDKATTVSPSPVPSAAPAPAPPTPPAAADVWNIVVRTQDVNGVGCVAETMQASTDVRKRYALSITPHGSPYDDVMVTLSSTAGDLACTFTYATVTADGFTTFGYPGYFSCEPFESIFMCADGTPHVVWSMGQNISGQIKGNEITGKWSVDWVVEDSQMATTVMSEFTGIR